MRKHDNVRERLCNIMNQVNSIIKNILFQTITTAEKNKERKSCEFNSTIKSETGSVTSMVTVTIIFFITILSSTYMLMAVQRRTQLKSQLSTKEAYQEEIDNANEIYYTLIGEDASVNIKEEYEENTYTNKNVYVYSRNNKKFSVNKDGNTIAIEQTSYILTEDGTYTISINKDTELEEHIVKIDKTQPTINNIEIADITSNSFKIKVNAEDSLSGIKQIRYSIDSGENCVIPTDNITECTIQHNGNIINNANIKIEVQDNAQNTNTSSKIVEAKEVNGVTIPDGFVYVGGTRDSGLVISDNNADKEKYKGQETVGTDLQGNQYVWIPCTTDSSSSRLKYERAEWKVEDDKDTVALKDELTLTDSNVTYTDTDKNNGINVNIAKEIVEQIKTEKVSVEEYGGFYIGRYETGKSGTTAVVKGNQEPYSMIIWSTAYSLAKGIGGGTGATTYLCSSYAWDTTINFIQNSGTINYATTKDNLNENWIDKEVKNSSGDVIKAANSSKILLTGLTTAKNNIFDMGGNVAEFTTEINPGTSESVILRGGSFLDSRFSEAAGYRWDGGPGEALNYRGFRITLFLK